MHHILIYNFFLLNILTARYVYTNILEGEAITKPPGFIIINSIFSFIIIITMAHSFIQLVTNLLAKPLNPRFRLGFFVGVTFFLISYTIGFTILVQSRSIQWLSMTGIVLFISAILTMLVSLAYLFLKSKEITHSDRRKPIQAFGFLYASGYTLPLVPLLLPHPINLNGLLMLLPVLNLCPLIWLKIYYPSFTQKTDSFININTRKNLTAIFQKYNITPREQEIITLILEGKSNKEIEDQLCISLNTVKNHIYSLFQKMGVKSRGQLVNLILKVQKGQYRI